MCLEASRGVFGQKSFEMQWIQGKNPIKDLGDEVTYRKRSKMLNYSKKINYILLKRISQETMQFS